MGEDSQSLILEHHQQLKLKPTADHQQAVQEAHHHQEDQLEVHLTSLVVSAAADQESNNPDFSSPVSLFQVLLNLNHHHKHHQATKQNQPKNLTTKKKNLSQRASKLAICS